MQTKAKVELEEIVTLIDEIVRLQEDKVFKHAQRRIPNITPEDVLQPNDYPILENNPEFRYEEGVLEGVRTVDMALRALICERED